MSDETFNPLAWHRAVLSERCTLDPYERLVLLTLVMHADGSGESYPGLGKLSSETGVSRRQVIRAVAAIEERGLLRRDRQLRGQGLGSNRYFLQCTPDTSALESLVPPRHYPSAPQALPLVPTGHLPSAPQAPQLLTELLSGTTQGTTQPAKSRSRSGSKGRKRAELPELPMPDDWQPTDKHKAYAAEHGLTLQLEVDAFLGWAEGKTAKSWNGTFTTRLANQAKWDLQRGGPRKGAVTVQRGGYQEREANELERQIEAAANEAE